MNESLQIIQGDALEKLRELPSESVHCVVTSPPYWGLRSYGCDGQYGLESTPEEYCEKMVAVFREVRRVLRRDGTLWLNLGDSYARSPARGVKFQAKLDGNGATYLHNQQAAEGNRGPDIPPGLKEKDLVGIPWRVAFALQADGWVLRSEIIWSKPNPMPESVTDRPTKAHETIFLFAKARWTGIYPPRVMNQADARWLALLIEAEGNIAIRRYTYRRLQVQHAVQIAVANSDRSILEHAQRIAGKGAILTAKGTNRPIFYLQWTTKEATELLWEVLPYMYGKRRQALLALYLESRRDNGNKGKRDDIFEKRGRCYHLRKEELELREKIWASVKALNQHKEIDLSWLPEIKEGKWIPNDYFYDAEAIKEGLSEATLSDLASRANPGEHNGATRQFGKMAGLGAGPRVNGNSRNKRSVWTVTTAPYPEAHFATYPPDLIKPCIMAGTSAKGCCAKCGAQWERIVERGELKDQAHCKTTPTGSVRGSKFSSGEAGFNWHDGKFISGWQYENKTLGWQPTCECSAAVVPCVCLDPFAGSGTTGMVALELGRKAVLIELNPHYIELIEQRCNTTLGLALA